MLARPFGLAGLAAVLLACGAPASPRPVPARPRPAHAGPEPLLGPARYVLTEGMGVVFGGDSSPLPRREPAISSGVRLVLDGGIIVDTAPSPEPLAGFAPLPARLGGGFVLWSDARTYRADTFLGPLRPIVDLAAEGGVRPWLGSFVLRTDLGMLEVDPRTLALRRTELASFADALALDDRRGARLDGLGRAQVTTDGGAHWSDVLEERGVRVLDMARASDRIILQLDRSASNVGALELGAQGLGPQAPPSEGRGELEGAMTPMDEGTQPESQRLAPADLANAVFEGALAPGGRAVVARDGGLRLLSVTSGQTVDDASFSGISDRFARCQPVRVGEELLLACPHPRGAHVLALVGDPGAPRLEATFPGPGDAFVAGLGGRFGYAGRCGSEPPGVVDFGEVARPEGAGEGNGQPAPDPSAMPQAGPPGMYPPPPGATHADEEGPAEPDPPRADDARFCARTAEGKWIERRLEGEDAKGLYRFVPADHGEVVALVLDRAQERGAPAKKAAAAPARPHPGVRVVHVRLDDPVFERARLPALPAASSEVPFRAVDTDFWLDASDGSVHGWVLTPTPDEAASDEPPEPAESIPQGAAGRLLPVSTRLGGPAAGLRIGPDGSLRVLPLPPRVVEVVRGGPFALARAAEEDGTSSYFETTDGGATWRPVQGPPVGSLEAPYSETAVHGCSALGCVLGDGLVRLGWGGPPPPKAPPETPELSPAINPSQPRPSPLALRCRTEPPAAAPGAHGAVPISLRSVASTPLGAVHDGKWSADVFLPFDPSLSPRHVTLPLPSLPAVSGNVVPVLTADAAAPVTLLLRPENLRIDLGRKDTKAALPFVYNGRTSVAAELDATGLVALDADGGALLIARGAAVRPVLRIVRAQNVTRERLTLALRPGKTPAFALATVSTTSGDILLADLDLVRGRIGPLRPAGNTGALALPPACTADPSAFRLLADVTVDLHLDPAAPDLESPYLPATARISAAPGRPACLLGLEVRLGQKDATLSVRLGPGGGAALREGERSTRASCAAP